MVQYELIDDPVYKYRLTKSHHHVLDHFELNEKANLGELIRLDRNLLFLRAGYKWDGASGPALDTVNFLRPSLIHDALYQLIAHDQLEKKPWKSHADKELRRLCKEDGMGWWRRQRVYAAVRIFGGANDRYRPSGV